VSAPTVVIVSALLFFHAEKHERAIFIKFSIFSKFGNSDLICIYFAETDITMLNPCWESDQFVVHFNFAKNG